MIEKLEDGLYKIESAYSFNEEKRWDFVKVVHPLMKYTDTLFIMENYAPELYNKAGYRTRLDMGTKYHSLTAIGKIEGYLYEGDKQYIVFKPGGCFKESLVGLRDCEVRILKAENVNDEKKLIGWIVVDK